jgi:hypothetical protein
MNFELVLMSRTNQTIVAQLSDSQGRIDAQLSRTRTSVTEHLQTAQELSLLRHSLSDELSHLSRELVSSISDNGEGKPTLLEDLETLHRNLKELESIKDYVQIIEHALKLRFVRISSVPDIYC